MKQIILFITIAFTVFEVLVAADVITIEDVMYLPENLRTQRDAEGNLLWWNNPVIWVIGATLIINFAGYVENVVVNDQPYDYNKFTETFYKYLPIIVVASQALPNGQSAILAVVLDKMKAALKK